MKKARIENNVVVEICDGNPLELFHPDVAVLFNADVDDSVKAGYKLENNVFVAPVVEQITESTPNSVTKISPLEFKLLFTSSERIAIKDIKSTDAVVEDWYEILDDPRLKEVDLSLKSTIDGLNYLVSKGILEEARVAEILAAKIA